jgi:RNA polymerase sigma-70 factor (ECF subfamily)
VSAANRFSAMFDELSPRVYAYARRQCDPTVAQDVVADTFLVAWRRWSDVPAEPLPWLLVVARNTLANHRRYAARQHRLTDSVGRVEQLAGPVAGADAGVVERDALLAGLAQLSDAEREALLLIAWDGLSNSQAAHVAGCSVRAFEVRLSRARARLSRAVSEPSPPAAKTDSDRPPSVPSGAVRREAT